MKKNKKRNKRAQRKARAATRITSSVRRTAGTVATTVVALAATPATTAAAAAPVFAIILDKNLNAHPNDYPITERDTDLARLRLVTSHSGALTLMPHAVAAQRRIEDKNLNFSPTAGQVDRGAIFELTPNQVDQ